MSCDFWFYLHNDTFANQINNIVVRKVCFWNAHNIILWYKFNEILGVGSEWTVSLELPVAASDKSNGVKACSSVGWLVFSMATSITVWVCNCISVDVWRAESGCLIQVRGYHCIVSNNWRTFYRCGIHIAFVYTVNVGGRSTMLVGARLIRVL